ncbi:uncharacterized protein LOC115472970 [Microcaecilia unicolor]|uniref:Uncharacterized protein LOC115472970 n=1 Tax=Microcaecilia unicolor TaxID=1415580 RepID=A0A6P7YEL6_9AMPH|nr:uncharacterized protein LOC115472970 [Microcaecilia unicolor]
MPHSKRKGKLRLDPQPTLTSSPAQASLERYFAGFSRFQREEDPIAGALGEARSPLGEETSLSPPSTFLIPPCPASTASLEGNPADPGSVSAGVTSEDPGMQKSTLKPEGTCLSSVKNPEVTLETIGVMLDLMNSTLQKTSGDVLNLNAKFEELKVTVESVKDNLTKQVANLGKEVESFKEFKTMFVKDNMDIRRKIEQLENHNRRLNLRLLNFPKLSGVTPIETFRRYLNEILKIPLDAIPPVNKIYFIPKPKGELRGTENITPDLQNISDILEQSSETILDRATLLISFVFEQDYNNILRLYFRNIKAQFCGSKVWIFPDVTKQTQQKRKAFLTLKQKTIDIGGSFFLAYPSKCVVKLGQTKYTFFSPEQLKSFLDMKQLK